MGSNPEFIFLNIYFFKKNKRRVWAASEGNVEVEVNDGCIKQTDGSSYYIWQYFTVSNSSETKKGGAKIAACKFCDKIFRGCCSTRLTAQILRRLVLGQTKAGIQTCIAINKKNDDGRAILKNAQQALCEVMREKEEGAASKSDQLDWSCASKAKAGVLQNETVWANAAKMPPEAWYEMYVKPWHPELAMVGMRVLSQVIFVSSCERNWSTHRHIQTKILNKLSPEKTEKLVYVDLTSKMAAAVCDAYELKMFAWDNEDV